MDRESLNAVLDELEAFMKSKKRDRLFRGMITDQIRRLRSKEPKNTKEPCYVCGKHQLICQHHHVPSAEELLYASELYNPNRDKGTAFQYKIFSLCPTHHAYYHLMERGLRDGKTPADDVLEMILRETSEYEMGILFQIFTWRCMKLVEMRELWHVE